MNRTWSRAVALVAVAWLAAACGSDVASPDCETDDSCSDGTTRSESESEPEEKRTTERSPGKSDAGAKDASASKPASSGSGAPASGSGKDASTSPALADAAKQGAKEVPRAGSGLPCDVKAVLGSACGTCHGEKPAFGAPMALASLADFQAEASTGEKMLEAVKKRINETDPRKAMPPASSDRLTSEQLATLNGWLDKGAPGDSASCSAATGEGGLPDPPTEVNTDGLDCFKFLAHAGDGKSKFKVGVATDAYYNITFKAPWQGTAYGVVFRPIIDNMEVIHHWLLFEDSSAGGASGPTSSVGAHPGSQLVHGWAPGGSILDYRLTGDDVGFELPGNVTYTVEYHYNSKDPNAQDASGVEVCIAKQKPANVAGLSWLGWDQLAIPATSWVGTCKPSSQQPIHILGVQPHMHTTGLRMKATINRANGQKEILHDEPFDFNYQRLYLKDKLLMPGDSITTECTFSEPMVFGESTGLEMCYLFTTSYPKGALADFGAWGSLAHGSSSCLGQ